MTNKTICAIISTEIKERKRYNKMKNMKMVYLFKDPYGEIVGAYQKPDDALKDLFEYNEEEYNFVDDERRAEIFNEANERAYKKRR